MPHQFLTKVLDVIVSYFYFLCEKSVVALQKNQVSNDKTMLCYMCFLSGPDSTQDLIREGESLARRYAVEDEPTRDRDPTRDVTQTATDTGVAAQVRG